MSALTVPEKDRKVLGELATVPQDRISALIEAISTANPMLTTRSLATKVAAAASMSDMQALRIIRLVTTMSAVRTREHLSIDAFSDRICDLAFSKEQEPSLSPEVQATLRGYLRQLLSINSLYITGKALEVMRDNERSMCEPRVITDLRTVFDLQDKPAAAMAIHLLRISYHEGGPERQQIVVALDSRDLRELRRVLERAEDKEREIKEIASKAALLWLSPVDDD
jgi:hypothetical protein